MKTIKERSAAEKNTVVAAQTHATNSQSDAMPILGFSLQNGLLGQSWI
jgi:hypothetical protein